PTSPQAQTVHDWRDGPRSETAESVVQGMVADDPGLLLAMSAAETTMRRLHVGRRHMSDRRIPKVGAKLLSSMLVASLTAVAIGAVDGAYAATAGGLSAGRSALSAAGAVGLVGLLLGVGQGLLLEAASWAERRLRVSARWADRLESEAVVVAIHAHVVSFAVACLASVPPLYFAAASSVAIQEDAMRFVLL